MHDNKVGVVAFYKISACLLCTFSAFEKICRLTSFFTVINILCYIHIKWDPNKDDKSNYHQQFQANIHEYLQNLSKL